MRILDRIILALFSLCALILSLFLIVIPFNLPGFLSMKSMVVFVGSMYKNYYYTVGGILLLIASIRVMFSYFTKNDLKVKGSYLITRSEYGEIIIYASTIVGLVESAIERFSDMSNIRTTVDLSEGQIKIDLIGDVLAGINIPEAIKELQLLVKEYVENGTGAKVDEIKVTTNNVSSHRVIR